MRTSTLHPQLFTLRTPPHALVFHAPVQACAVRRRLLEKGARARKPRAGGRAQLHASISTETGATIFLRGAEPHAHQLLV